MEIKYIFSMGELFERVQMEDVFPDNKTFVDCTPNAALSYIRNSYEKEKNNPGFSLPAFVHQHFTLPKEIETDFVSVKGRPVKEHIEKLWDVLTRQPEESHNSLVPLPKSYIVPGGRFREIYYWDSYFTMLGLQVSKRTDLIENMVDNFCFLIDSFGYIPNGNRTYYLGRSQPPFFACMVSLLSEEKGEDILVKYLPQLIKEYKFWMKGKSLVNLKSSSLHHVAMLPDKSILNHYWDASDTPRPEAYKHEVALAKNAKNKKKLYHHLRAAAESGWDFSARWFKIKGDFSSIHATEIIPVDLNCLLLNLEQTIAKAYQVSGEMATAEKYNSLAKQRKKNIDKYCWNEEQGFYFDFDQAENKQKEVFTLAAVFPLFFGIASHEQAAGVAKVLKKKFLSYGGLISTLETTNQQWDAPNGWAPLQWVAVQGLAKYGFPDLAIDIAKRWLAINKKVYEETGKMMEKYNVVATDLKAGGGEYPAQDGFGWTNGVYLALDKWLNEIH
ncbi:MAG: alpha,alpha-trehalase TreA [Bacteroidota bacterium]|nr:alpha,alpha-trehalase TreA [Bacteroidota bacterium]